MRETDQGQPHHHHHHHHHHQLTLPPQPGQEHGNHR